MKNTALERPTRGLRRTSPFWSSPLDRFFRNDPFDVFDGDGFADTTPSLNIKEEEKNYIVELAAPGLKRDDFDINVEGDLLTISCETENETEEGKQGSDFWRREFNYTNFSRSVTLPDHADSKGIVAKYTDGILHLIIPKKPEAQRLTQKIKVQ
jgi:HSP20 family protein